MVDVICVFLGSLVPALEKRLTRFIDDTKKLRMTDSTYVVTNEGKDAVLDAIEYLKDRAKKHIVAEDLIWSTEAANVCKKHVQNAVEAATQETALISTDAHTEFKRLFEEEFDGEEKIGGHAECHEYGSLEALEVLLNLIVDDGNQSRSNRKTLFGNWDYVGCSSQDHPKYKRMTSIMFVVAEDTMEKEMSSAVKAAEAELGLEDDKKYDWVKKQTNVNMNGKGIITVTFTLLLRNGKEEVVEYKCQSKQAN